MFLMRSRLSYCRRTDQKACSHFWQEELRVQWLRFDRYDRCSGKAELSLSSESAGARYRLAITVKLPRGYQGVFLISNHNIPESAKSKSYFSASVSAFFCHYAPKDEPKFPTVGFVCGTARSRCSALGQMRRTYYAQMFGRKEKCKAKLSIKMQSICQGRLQPAEKHG